MKEKIEDIIAQVRSRVHAKLFYLIAFSWNLTVTEYITLHMNSYFIQTLLAIALS